MKYSLSVVTLGAEVEPLGLLVYQVLHIPRAILQIDF